MPDFRATKANDVPDLVRRQVRKRMREVGKYQQPSAAARAMQFTTDVVVERNRVDPGRPFACSKGCSYCCYVQTDIYAGEAFVLADAVRKMPDEQRQRVVDRLRENAEKLSNLSLSERLNARVPCALLDLEKGACSVYQSRPRACRRWHSFDAEACKVSVETNTGRGNPIDPVVLAGADLVCMGYEQATKHPFGELHQGVVLALEPDSERRFSKGEPVFAGWTATADAMTEDEKEVLSREVSTFFDAANEMSRVMPR